jgi:hypothetical protein
VEPLFGEAKDWHGMRRFSGSGRGPAPHANGASCTLWPPLRSPVSAGPSLFQQAVDFSHLGVLHTATFRPSTNVLQTFCRSLWNTDTQRVAIVKGTCSCWKARL